MTRNKDRIRLARYDRRSDLYKLLITVEGKSNLSYQFVIYVDLHTSYQIIEIITPFSGDIIPMKEQQFQSIDLTHTGANGILMVIEREKIDQNAIEGPQSPNESEAIYIDLVGPDYLKSISWKNMEIWH